MYFHTKPISLKISGPNIYIPPLIISLTYLSVEKSKKNEGYNETGCWQNKRALRTMNKNVYQSSLQCISQN